MAGDLTTLFDRLAQSRDRVLTLVAATDEPHRATRPGAGQWSMLQVIEHLVLAEEGTLRVLRQGPGPQPRVTVRSRLALRAIEVLFGLGARVRVPSKSLAPAGADSLDTLRSRWNEAREGIAAVVEGLDAEALRQPRFRHPVAGWLTVGQGLDFLERHIRHHERQLHRIRRALNPPQPIEGPT
ncbi:MAG: DinB family protein [Gemmatimonadales bacterium]|jgi:hypothetical protein|nr:MAG: DinB family protein [Gemmatimonadales bacterium]